MKISAFGMVKLWLLSAAILLIGAFFVLSAPEAKAANYQYVPTGQTLVTGTDQNVTGATLAATEGVNMGSWRGTLANDSTHWAVASTTSGIDMQLNVAGVELNGANKLILETEIDLDATIPTLKVQICDWVNSTGVDNAADAQCTTGGWRTVYTQNASNADVNYTDTANDGLIWHLYDGYFSTGTSGGTPISTPLSNFVNGSDTVKVRYYSTTNTTSVVSIDFLRITTVIDSIYHPSNLVNQGSGAAVGTYSSAVMVGNIAAGQMSVTAGDAIYVTVAGTVATVADFYMSFTNVKTLAGMNTILVRADYSCSAATGNIIPQIRNFNSSTWENLSAGTIACSATDAVNGWAKNNITMSDYISNGEIRVRFSGSSNGTHTLRIDGIYVMVGSVNTDSSLCEITMGTGTATNCTNTRTLDMTTTTSSFDNPAEDESATMGTGSANSIYAMDNESTTDTTVEEATSSNIYIPMTLAGNTQVAGVHYAARFAAGTNGATALTVQPGIRDFAGISAATGGWIQVGGTSANATQAYTDSVTALSLTAYGYMNNPDDFVDTYNDRMNIRLRPTAAGTSTTNATTAWDFAMLSLMWIESPDSPTLRYQYTPTLGTVVTGTDDQNVNTIVAAAIEGVNRGWRSTMTDENFQWVVSSTASGIDMQLEVGGVELNGANKMLIQTEMDLDTTVPAMKVQICDWVTSTGVDNAADARCTTGGWRSLNTQNASNVDVNYTDTAGDALQWHIYDGYFTTGTSGGVSVSTPLSNFVNTSDGNKVLIRYFSTTSTTTTVAVDYLRVTAIIDSVYYPASLTNLGTGAMVGTYASAIPVGNIATGIMTLATGDALYVTIAGTASTVSNSYFTFKNVKTMTGMNTIMVRGDYSCSAATGNIIPKIWNFNSATWENLSAATIACSTTDTVNYWAKNNITLTDYISSGEIRVAFVGSSVGTHTMRIDGVYVIVGVTNTDSNTCQITLGTGTATNCTNTRTIDTNSAVSVMANPAELESTNMGSGEAASIYGLDSDADATAENATASNMDFSLTQSANTSVVGLNYSLRFQGGTTNGTNPDITVQAGLKDLSAMNQLTGGWTAMGAASTIAAYIVTDTVTAMTNALYGFQHNPDDYLDTYNNRINLRLRTSVGGISSQAQTTNWDFAMVSLQWIETPAYVSGITIAGTIYSGVGVSAYDCSSNNLTLAFKVNGSGAVTTTCSAANGTYTSSAVSVSAPGDVLTVYLDGETEKAVFVTRINNTSSNLTGIDLYQDFVRLDHEDAGPITNTNLDQFDSTGDADVVYTVTAGALTVDSGKTLMVASGATYTPGGNVTADKLRLAGTMTAGSNTVTINGTGTGASRPFYNLGTFNYDTSTFEYKGDGDLDINGGNYYDLVVNPTITNNRAYGVSGTLTVNNNLTVNPTAAGALAVTMTLGGDSAVTGSTTLTGTTAGTSSLNTNASGNYLFTSGSVNIATAGVLTANNSIVTITGSGTAGSRPFIVSGTFTAGASTFRYTGIAATEISAATYYNLEFKPASGTPTFGLGTGAAQTITVENNFVVGSGTSVTVDANTYDPVIDITGDLTIAASGTLQASNTSTFSVGGVWSNSGTFTHNNGTVTFDNVGTNKSITAGGSSFANVILTSGTERSNTTSMTIAGSSLYLTGGSTLSGTGDVLVTAGTAFGNGTINKTGGNFLLDNSGSFHDSPNNWTFYDLTFGDGTGSSVTAEQAGAGDIIVTHVLTVAANHTLTVDNIDIILTGSGTPLVTDGTLTIGVNTLVKYTGTGTVNIPSRPYDNLEFSPTNTASYVLGAGNLNVGNNFVVGGGAGAITVDAATNDPNINIYNDFTWTAGTFTKSDSNGTIIFSNDDDGQVWTPSGTSDFGAIVASMAADIVLTVNASVKISSLAISFGGVVEFTGTPTLTITGSANAFDVSNGTFIMPADMTVEFAPSGTDNVNVPGMTYKNLSLNPASGTPTITLGSGAAQTVRVDGTLTMSSDSIVTSATHNPTLDLRGDLSIAIGANYTKGSGTTYFKKGGAQIWADATVMKQDIGNVVVQQNGTDTNVSLGSDVKATSLTIDASQILALGSRTLSLTANGSGMLTINGTLSDGTGTIEFAPSATTGVTVPVRTYYGLKLNKAGNTFAAADGTYLVTNLTVEAGTFDMNTNDPTFTVNRDLVINGILAASNTGAFLIKGDFINNGTFTHNSGTVSVNPALYLGTSLVGGTSNTVFHNFTANAPANEIKFKHSAPTKFEGVLTLQGAPGLPLKIGSNHPTNQWELWLTGTASWGRVLFSNTGCYTGTNSVDLNDEILSNGNNGACLRFIIRGGGGSSIDGESGGSGAIGGGGAGGGGGTDGGAGGGAAEGGGSTGGGGDASP